MINFLGFPAFTQNHIDTLEVYNVYCQLERTTENGNLEFWSWGGDHCSFHTSIPCPEPVEKYIENFLALDSLMASGNVFWMKLLDTNEVLLYEGLKFSDCSIGPFIDYHPNGRVRLVGQYAGWNSRTGKARLLKRRGKPKGTWYYYDMDGKLINEEKK